MTATGVESQIAEALLARLAALTLSPVLQVAYPNKAFPTPPAVDKPDTYLQASLLRASTRGIGINAWDERAGILQVDVLYKAQDGEIKPLQIADSVAAWFGRGTLPNIYETPSVGSAMPNGDGYLKIPVSVRYRTFIR